MKQTLTIFVALATMLAIYSCKDNKPSQDIITKIQPKASRPSGPQTMSTGAIPPKTINWGGTDYTVSIVREVDKSLPLIEDASGTKYYDNSVRLTITRKDGTKFFDRKFTRRDFEKYADFSYARHWGLTGFNFNSVEGDKLTFAIAIGSPDEMADNEFVPITLLIDRNAHTSVLSQQQESSDDEDAPAHKTEDEMSEEEGI